MWSPAVIPRGPSTSPLFGGCPRLGFSRVGLSFLVVIPMERSDEGSLFVFREDLRLTFSARSRPPTIPQEERYNRCLSVIDEGKESRNGDRA
jgi:hypothetical protein